GEAAELPEPVGGGLGEALAEEGVRRHAHDERPEGVGDGELAGVAEVVHEGLRLAFHDRDVGVELAALEAGEDDLALALVLVVGREEVEVGAEHPQEERIRGADRELVVGLVEGELVVLGAEEDDGVLQWEAEAEHGAVLAVAAPEEPQRVAGEFGGVSDQRAGARERRDRRGGIHMSPQRVALVLSCRWGSTWPELIGWWGRR